MHLRNPSLNEPKEIKSHYTTIKMQSQGCRQCQKSWGLRFEKGKRTLDRELGQPREHRK